VEPSSQGQKYGALVVSSTTGNGDPPENAGRFTRFVKKQNKDKSNPKPFEHVAYAVLALGDTNYDQFCETGSLIDRLMNSLGGTRAKPLVCADEGTGLLEETVDPWMATVAEDVARACTGGSSGGEEKVDDDANEAAVAPPTGATNETAAAAATIIPAPEKSPSPLYVMYGSATGNAEAIAKELSSTYEMILNNPDSKTYFPEVVCTELNQFKKMKLAEEVWSKPPVPGNPHVKHGLLIVASTTGNGDAPENSDKFLRYLKKSSRAAAKDPSVRSFEHVAFAVLGLGDTNYDQYCEHAKLLNKHMTDLGGTPIRPLACADEGTGQLEEVVDGWTQSILMQVTEVCRGDNAAEAVLPAAKPVAKPVAKKEKKKTIHQEEEKKVEPLDEDYRASSSLPASTSPGVLVVRSLLDLMGSGVAATEAVNQSTLPKASLASTSVKFVSDDYNTGSSNAITEAIDDDDRSEDGLRYTLEHPFESSVVGARYLTATSPGAADEICEFTDSKAGTTTTAAKDVLERRFPLQVENDAREASRNGKRVIELRLSLPSDQSWEYQPGDSLGMIVSNTPESVGFVLSMLKSHHGTAPTQKVSLDEGLPLTVEEIVRDKIDLSTVAKNRKVLFALSQISTDPHETSVLELLASKTDRGSELLEKFVNAQRRSIVDLLREFPSCQGITLENLMSILPPIPPRYYSVSSSPLDATSGDGNNNSLTVTFSVVDYLTPSLQADASGREIGLRRVHGVATGYLEALCSPFLSSRETTDDPAASASRVVQIFPKPSEEFHLPEDPAIPLVLVGPGTGIAPFMGFLAHRKGLLAAAAAAGDESTGGGAGSVEVFFGCRHADHDHLYKEEMESFRDAGVVDHVHTAFSRDNGTKKEYVQDLMVNNADTSQRLVDTLMKKNGRIYVCGDGNHMGRDVQATFAKLLGPHLASASEGSSSTAEESGKAYIEEMKKEGRFLLDIWS